MPFGGAVGDRHGDGATGGEEDDGGGGDIAGMTAPRAEELAAAARGEPDDDAPCAPLRAGAGADAIERFMRRLDDRHWGRATDLWLSR